MTLVTFDSKPPRSVHREGAPVQLTQTLKINSLLGPLPRPENTEAGSSIKCYRQRLYHPNILFFHQASTLKHQKLSRRDAGIDTAKAETKAQTQHQV